MSDHATRKLTTVIARFEVSNDDPNYGDPKTEQVVLTLDQPLGDHNGGWLGFGPLDGFLYVALGDGSFDSAGPPRAQDTTDNLFGSILRLDIDGDDFPADLGRNYAVPPDNPFVAVEGDDEIWAYGLRNPFRCAFDSETGDLWIGDVGQSDREEINVIPAESIPPRNLGWGCMEGSLCMFTYCVCNDPTLTAPVLQYAHGPECAVIGGPVYRGCAMPELQGAVFFGDFCSTRIWSMRYDGNAVTGIVDRTAELDPPGPTPTRPVAFGTDARGEIYIVSFFGPVLKIVPADPLQGPDPCNSCPADINESGGVDFSDLTLLLSKWGPCQSCGEDFNRDGAVGFSDLSQLLVSWGPC